MAGPATQERTSWRAEVIGTISGSDPGLPAVTGRRYTSDKAHAGLEKPSEAQYVPVRCGFFGSAITAEASRNDAPVSRSGRRPQAALRRDEGDDPLEPFALLQVGHHEGPFAAHAPGVGLHLLERGAHMRRQVDLVDYQKVRAGDTWTALRRNLVAGRDIDDVDRDVG